ncbi:MAG: hypothetical protein H0W72_05345, partial [Planctomycetes bacterium]|nr:hypothetical protein [Planctomycetota bacterium]
MPSRVLSDLVGTLRSYFGLTPAGSSGAPSSGTYKKGAIYCDSAATLWVCTASGTPGTWSQVGSATPGTTLINYCANPDAEIDTTGWTGFNDGGSDFIDGTGGTSSLTFTRSTSSPIRGAASFLLSKPASATAGHGVSCEFTVLATDILPAGRPMIIELEASVSALDWWVSVYDTVGAVKRSVGGSNSIATGTYGRVNSSGFHRFAFIPVNAGIHRLIVGHLDTGSVAATLTFDTVRVYPSTDAMAGRVLQCVTVRSDDNALSTTSTTYVDTTVGAATLPLTVRSANSKVHIRATGAVGASADMRVMFTLYRSINGGSYAAITPAGVDCLAAVRVTTTSDAPPISLSFVDTPGVGAIAYKLYWKTN